jgi:hypothetical protein
VSAPLGAAPQARIAGKWFPAGEHSPGSSPHPNLLHLTKPTTEGRQKEGSGAVKFLIRDYETRCKMVALLQKYPNTNTAASHAVSDPFSIPTISSNY